MADPFDIWSADARAFRTRLEALLCRHGSKPYASHPENKRVGFGWPLGETKHHILALGEDTEERRGLVVRLTVGPGHGLVTTGSPFYTPPTRNPKDEKERVDCLIRYGGSLPRGFREAVEMAFKYMLSDPKLAKFRDPDSPPGLPAPG